MSGKSYHTEGTACLPAAPDGAVVCVQHDADRQEQRELRENDEARGSALLALALVRHVNRR
jgi:hypothetical protein